MRKQGATKRTYRVSKEGASRSQETRGFRKRLENLRTRSKPLGRNQGVSGQGANRSKETREFRKRLENLTRKTDSKLLKEQTARKRLENFERC